ncbi:MAG: hypothetical protein AAFV98_18285 [Chloroflexota bacterium]
MVIVGGNDETMQADAFPDMMAEVAPDGERHIITGETHGSVRYTHEFIQAARLVTVT